MMKIKNSFTFIITTNFTLTAFVFKALVLKTFSSDIYCTRVTKTKGMTNFLVRYEPIYPSTSLTNFFFISHCFILLMFCC